MTVLEGDRIARPYLTRETRSRIAVAVPPEIDLVTVTARAGAGDWSAYLWRDRRRVGEAHEMASIVTAVELAVADYEGRL